MPAYSTYSPFGSCTDRLLFCLTQRHRIDSARFQPSQLYCTPLSVPPTPCRPNAPILCCSNGSKNGLMLRGSEIRKVSMCELCRRTNSRKEEADPRSGSYKKAYDSMKACPLTFDHPSEAQQLHGLGPKLCDRLTERLKAHCTENGLPMPELPHKGAHNA